MTELYVAEIYWPTGGPADTLRALLVGRMMAASQGDQASGRKACETWKKLAGLVDPAAVNNKSVTAKKIKLKMSAFV